MERVGLPDGTPRPSMGRIVRYRGKQGLLAMRPAIVVCDVDNLDPRGVAAGAIPALTDDMHAHLHVFTTGESSFTEHDVAYGDGPGQWSWPPRS